MIQELNAFFLQNICDLDVILEPGNAEDDIMTTTWNHNLEKTITRVEIFFDYRCSKMSKAHLKKSSNIENCFL